MTTPVTLLPLVESDGILYSNATVLTGTEADLANVGGLSQTPVGIEVNNAFYVFASIKLTVIAPQPSSGKAWVAVQTALPDNVWYDLAWVEIDSSILPGSYSYAFCSGSVTQSGLPPPRVLGSDPGPTNISGLFLGGQLRFTGKSSFNQGQVAATIYYKLQGLR